MAKTGRLENKRETALREQWDRMRTNTLTQVKSEAESQMLKAFERWSKDGRANPLCKQIVLGTPQLLNLASEVTIDRLDRRRTLLAQLDRQLSRWERDTDVSSHDRLYRHAFNLLLSSRCRGAFDLTQVDPKVRDRYGRSLFGESVLIARRLIEEGCSRSNYSIGYRDSDVFCLMQIDGIWRVFYTERGLDQEPIFESKSEHEACEFFFKYQTERIQHVHIVGQFYSKDKADELDIRLQRLGLQTWLNHIPHEHWNVARVRVFVIGKDVFRARELLGEELPLRDKEQT